MAERETGEELPERWSARATAFGDDEFFGLYRRVAQAILKMIPGAHREEEPPELDVVSIQPG